MSGSRGSIRLRTAARWATALGTWVLMAAAPARADFTDFLIENLELHGFARTTTRFNSPDLSFGKEFQLDSFKTEFNLELSANLYEGRDLSIKGFTILRPSYEAVYDLYPDIYGKRAKSGAFGTQLEDPRLPNFGKRLRNPSAFVDAESVPGAGGGIDGQFRFANNDAQFLFNGNRAPCLAIDNQLFFGLTCAPSIPRGTRQPKVGGNPTLAGFTGGLGITSPSLAGSIGRARAAGRSFNSILMSPDQRRIYGDRGSFRQAPFDINATQAQLQTDCGDNAHPTCFLREAYLDFTYKNTFVRLGRQQIVFGKTDAFRLQDIVNPQDLGQRNIFDPLEDRRIPQFALDVNQSFGNVGPFEDVSAEFVWNLDRFLPTQVGQCGDVQAFAVACQGRSEAFAFGQFGFSTAGVQEIPYQLRNTEPGFRLEWRLPQPSLSFSLSGYYGFQDEPVGRIKNAYSLSNPNPAALLFLQSLGAPEQLQMRANQQLAASGGLQGLLGAAGGLQGAARQLAPLLGPRLGQTLAAAQRDPGNAGAALIRGIAPNFTGGFDPYNTAQVRQTAGEVSTLYKLLSGNNLQGLGGAFANCRQPGVSGRARCISDAGLQPLLLPFSGGAVELENPRVFTLGGSVDYQLPAVDSVLSLEFAYDFDRGFVNTAKSDLEDSSDVLRVALGADFNPFIPFLNPGRTALVSTQLFAEHILDYEDKGNGRRFIPDENQVIATAFMQNFWRNDSVILTNFVAYDVNAQALAYGPSVKYIFTNNVFVEFGASLLQGKKQRRPLQNLCKGGTLTNDCLTDPANFQPGTFQSVTQGFARSAEGPFFQDGFADGLNKNRDEVFFSLTYQF